SASPGGRPPRAPPGAAARRQAASGGASRVHLFSARGGGLREMSTMEEHHGLVLAGELTRSTRCPGGIEQSVDAGGRRRSAAGGSAVPGAEKLPDRAHLTSSAPGGE